MKKWIVFLLLDMSLTACNNDTGPSAAQLDSAVKATADSLKTTADKTVRKIDSTLMTAADSVKLRLNARVDSLDRAIRK